MKIKHILRYTISTLIALMSFLIFCQEDNETVKDSIVIEQKYGLRIGSDLGKLSRTFFDENYSDLKSIPITDFLIIFMLLVNLVLMSIPQKQIT